MKNLYTNTPANYNSNNQNNLNSDSHLSSLGAVTTTEQISYQFTKSLLSYKVKTPKKNSLRNNNSPVDATV